ncbi:MAG: transcription-repair coupling factor, partial [Mycobacteriales bacterium]
MSLAGLLDVLTGDPALAEAIAAVGEVGEFDLAGPRALRPFVVAALARTGRTVLAVTATERECDELALALTSLLPAETVADFPSWETLPHERLSPRPDTVGRRLAVLRRLAHPDPDSPTLGRLAVVVAPIRAVLQPLVAGLGDLEPVRLGVGDRLAMDEVVA